MSQQQLDSLCADYGFGHGFECISSADTRRECIATRKEYRDNGDYAPMKIVKTLEKLA